MLGIVGIVRKHLPADRSSLLSDMLRPTLHEPFYVSGSMQQDSLEAAVGWTTHQGSYSDCLPIWNETRDICLIFWGEHFGDGSEVQKLRKAGHACEDSTDARWLVHLYEEQGPKFFELLNGTFHGLVIDLREKKLVLFNDRYGLGRLYYHEADDGFYFGAEAKSLLRVLPQLRRFDLRSLGEFYSCGCALQNRTLFEGISLLPPGSIWTFRPGQRVLKEAYFRKEAWEALSQLPAEAYYQKLKDTFTRILPRYFTGKQPISLSLTGGLDSRMIIAAAQVPAGAIPCHTFGGNYRDSEDVKVARRVAELCRQPHEVLRVDEKFLPQFLKNAERCVYITDGAMDVSGAVGLYVNRQARGFGLVRMTGNYGSEILRGNVAFKAGYVGNELFDDAFAAIFRQASETYRTERNTHRLSFIAFKQVPWHHYCRFAEENSQLIIRSPYLDNELVSLAYQAPPGLLLHKQLALRFCAELKPELAAAPTDRGVLKRPVLLPEKVYQLWKELGPKAEYFFDYGMPQWLARVDRLLAPLHLERLFLGQQKYYHFRTWYRHQLAGQVREVLLDPQTLQRPYLKGSHVERLVAAHTAGTGNYTLELHKILTSELIERTLLKS